MAMRRMVVLAGTAALVGSGVTAAHADDADDDRYVRQAFRATNAQREDDGLGKLRANDCLDRAAIRQAKRMAERQQLFHQDLRKLLRSCGLSRAGENVADGYDNGKAVGLRGWMESAGHRANILDRSYRLMGIGAHQSDDGVWYAAQVFGRQA